MKTTYIKYMVMGLFMSTIPSCDILDIDPLDSYTQEDVFSDASLTKAYVHRNYTLPMNGWDHRALRFACDESYNNFNWNGSYTVIEGNVTPDQLGNLDIWSAYYENIKNCNLFFENIDKVNNIDQPERDYLIGEATFFRAFYYMELVNRYGGVPMITKAFGLEDNDMMDVKRESYKNCVNTIVQWFDEAANLLPESYSGANFGRVTKIAALAMKSRLLLYAASPLWSAESGITYKQAADAAKAVIDLCGGDGNHLDPDYKGLFLNPKSSEIIFQRLYTQEHGHWFDWENTPNGWGGYSATCVTQEMVDSYEMADGTMPDKAWYTNGTTANPWENRDPRFYASIVCDGQQFRDRTIEFWVNEDGKTGGNDSEYGRDNWNHSKTHYTIRKFMDESLLRSWSYKGKQPWIYCRLAEIYLNYAEAMFWDGKEDIARTYVNYVRERARGGNPDIVPDVTESGDALWKRIQNERKIELAFEEHRFFDVRRWKIAEDTQVGQFHGVRITKMADGSKKYEVVNVGNKRNFVAPNHYLLPIPNYERRKNTAIEQNPGYSDL